MDPRIPITLVHIISLPCSSINQDLPSHHLHVPRVWLFEVNLPSRSFISVQVPWIGGTVFVAIISVKMRIWRRVLNYGCFRFDSIGERGSVCGMAFLSPILQSRLLSRIINLVRIFSCRKSLVKSLRGRQRRDLGDWWRSVHDEV